MMMLFDSHRMAIAGSALPGEWQGVLLRRLLVMVLLLLGIIVHVVVSVIVVCSCTAMIIMVEQFDIAILLGQIS